MKTPKVDQLVAYGLYKVAKREWALEFRARNQKPPNASELTEYTATWTRSQLDGAVNRAEAALADYATFIIDSQTPRIREDALRGTFGKALGTNMLAAFLYTLALIGLLILLKFAGIDLLGLLDKIGPPGR